MEFNHGFATDIGRKRQQNQDNGGAFPELGLFFVADGMGGHRGGETASAMTAEILPSVVSQQNGSPAAQALLEAIRAANQAIFERASHENELQGMGTTTTALLFRKDRVFMGHVGDSRCYFFRGGSMWQATRDHSLVQEKLRAGLITRDEVRTDRMKNVITRSVGFEPHLNVEIYEMLVLPGDVFLICSDGLSGLVDDSQIRKIVEENLKQGPQHTVQNLIEAANQNGGDDNITAVIIEVTHV